VEIKLKHCKIELANRIKNLENLVEQHNALLKTEDIDEDPLFYQIIIKIFERDEEYVQNIESYGNYSLERLYIFKMLDCIEDEYNSFIKEYSSQKMTDPSGILDELSKICQFQSFNEVIEKMEEGLVDGEKQLYADFRNDPMSIEDMVRDLVDDEDTFL